MPRRIRIPDRVIIDERVPIPGLRALRGGGDDGVGGGETSQRGVHPARVEEVDSEAGFFALTCELVVRAQVAESIPRLTEGFVERGSGLGSIGIGRDRRTAEVVAEQEAQCPARAAPRGEARGTGKIIFRDCCTFFLVPQGDDIVIADVVRGHTVDSGLDLLSIRIVVEAGRRRAGH